MAGRESWEKNIRDYASLNQLLIPANMESTLLIEQKKLMSEHLVLPGDPADRQMRTLLRIDTEHLVLLTDDRSEQAE